MTEPTLIESRWGEHGARPRPLDANASIFTSFRVEVSIDVDRPAGEVFGLVTDVARIGAFSPECVEAEWIDGADGPAVGARFEGTNRIDGDGFIYRWTRPCTVVIFDPPRRFGYTVGDRFDGSPAGDWTFDVAPTGTASCRLTQTFAHRPHGLSAVRLQADAEPQRASELVAGRVHGLRAGMTATLQAMKAALETG